MRLVPNTLPAAPLGAAVSLGTWLLAVPWDLSEVDADGRVLEQGGDDYGGMIALVAALVVAIAIVLLLAPRTRRAAPWFAAGGLAAWAALFAWRAGSAETSGANLFLVPLVMVVIPLAVAVPPVLGYLASRLAQQG